MNDQGKKKSSKKKIKYSDEYISYIENGDSAAVFIVRDIVKSINTSGMWIDVIDTSGYKNIKKDSKWDFSSITVEFFPRKIKPIYPKDASEGDIKYITWETATEDIDEQRSQGFKGEKFTVYPKLVNKNKGKTRTIEKKWNKKFNQYIPKRWGKSSDCEIVKVKVPIKPEWEYHILSVKRL